MESRNIILKELQELSHTLASTYPVPVPYKVPDGYFDQLPSQVLHRVKDNNITAVDELKELSPLLSSISKKLPYQAPENYFNSLSENTLAETKAVAFVQEELDEFSPVLHNLKKASVYQVPAGYFDQLPAIILQKVKPAEAKVVTMKSSGIRRYISAAAAVLILAAGAWWYFQPSNIVPPATAGVEKVSDDELLRYIDDQSLASDETIAALASMDADNNMQELFAEVSDEELQQYIDKNNGLLKTISN